MPDARIQSCPSCGTKNRVPATAVARQCVHPARWRCRGSPTRRMELSATSFCRRRCGPGWICGHRGAGPAGWFSPAVEGWLQRYPSRLKGRQNPNVDNSPQVSQRYDAIVSPPAVDPGRGSGGSARRRGPRRSSTRSSGAGWVDQSGSRWVDTLQAPTLDASVGVEIRFPALRNLCTG